MELSRVHVYAVDQQRMSERVVPPKGGQVALADLSTDFLAILEQHTRQKALDDQPAIAFEKVNGQHIVRQKIVSLAFGDEKESCQSAFYLADKLSRSMDSRSPKLLLLMTVHQELERRRVTLWAFPKDIPIQVQTTKKVILKNVKNAFSTTSTYTKVAKFEGVNSPRSFNNGTVIDGVRERTFDPAQYWASGFLEGTLIFTSSHGTHHLAKTLKSVIASCDDPIDRKAVSEAVIAVRALQDEMWSFSEIAETFLPDDLQSSFLDNAPIGELDTKFRIDKAQFERELGTHVFVTDDGVVITAPFESINNTVVVDRDNISVRATVAMETFNRGKSRNVKKAQ